MSYDTFKFQHVFTKKYPLIEYIKLECFLKELNYIHFSEKTLLDGSYIYRTHHSVQRFLEL